MKFDFNKDKLSEVNQHSDYSCWYIDDEVVGWMPLPEPPKGGV